jgi:UDP-3-O-[3-hydroxymyristoyl] N-acetylglucosamine deacetylase/3-hydroxyacyl-[acyl-carrier-protein] dehydratase
LPGTQGFDGNSEDFSGAGEMRPGGAAGRQRELAITEEISITDGDKAIYALPNNAPGLTITYELDYTEHTGIGRQLFSCEFSQEQFAEQLATARTFVLEAEARYLQSRGIGTHLTPKDILVISSDGPIKNSYRFDNECVRHKVADLIGDLALVGRPLSGRIVAYKSGHLQNQRLARKLVQMAQRLDRKGGSSTAALMDIRRIQKILPHRYPFLLVDKIVEIDGDRRIKGVKNVTFNELFFRAISSTPIMPGVLIIEQRRCRDCSLPSGWSTRASWRCC